MAISTDTANQPASTTPAPSKHVVFFGMDGTQWSRVLELQKQGLLPVLNQLHSRETYTGGNKADNTQQQTVSGPGWTTLLTGTWANVHKVDHNEGGQATEAASSIFERIKDAKPNAEIDANAHWKNIFGQFFRNEANDVMDNVHSGGTDRENTDITLKQIVEGNATFIFQHYEAPDAAGHHHGYAGSSYDDAVIGAFNQLARVLDAINKRMQEHPEEDWMLISATDHGRTADGVDHGHHSSSERQSFVLSNKPLATGTSPAPVTAVVPTILDFLNIEYDRKELPADSLLLDDDPANGTNQTKDAPGIEVFGTEKADNVDGGAGNDILWGGAGNDRMRGGDGLDTMNGGDGNDRMNGGTGDDTLSGDDGDDTLKGGSGNDTIKGGTGQDWLYGENGDDKLFGNSGDDRLYGGAGKDLLSGGSGKDALDGGDGDDTVFGGEGDDRISGGDGNDILIGDDGEDSIDGASGKDWLHGGKGDDQLFGGSGDDKLYGAAGKDMLSGGSGNDTLEGGAGNDTLVGGTGRDVLDGSLGVDTMEGGTGGDSYYVDNIGDVIIEKGENPDALARLSDAKLTNAEWLANRDKMLNLNDNDRIFSSISFTLKDGTNIENLTLTGTAKINATGNSRDNMVIGNDGVNVLDGGDGNDLLKGGGGADTLKGGNGDDWLSGGTGHDVLTGGTGRDVFSFGTEIAAKDGKISLTAISDASDTVTDFVHGVDKIALSVKAFANFTGMKEGSSLSAASFLYGTSGKNGASYICYDKATGNLWYDTNGTAAGATLIAHFDTKPALDATDFLFVA